MAADDALLCARCHQEIVPGAMVSFVGPDLTDLESGERRIFTSDELLVVHADCPVPTVPDWECEQCHQAQPADAIAHDVTATSGDTFQVCDSCWDTEWHADHVEADDGYTCGVLGCDQPALYADPHRCEQHWNVPDEVRPDPNEAARATDAYMDERDQLADLGAAALLYMAEAPLCRCHPCECLRARATDLGLADT